VVLYAAARLLVLLAFVVAGAAHTGLGLRTATSSWDGGFYLRIARHGYPTKLPAHGASVLAFFPGFPLVIRGLHAISGLDFFAAGVSIVGIAGLAATCGVWLLTRELADTASADRATALFAFAPGAFVLSMVYSEALFALYAIALCWALLRRRWILAGVIGAIGTATRPDGLAFVVAIACAAYVAIRERDDRRSLLAIPISAIGFVVVQLYIWAHTGDAFAFFRAEQRGWNQHFSVFGSGRYEDARSIWHTITQGTGPDWNHIAPLAGCVVFVAAFVALVRWRPPLELIGLTAGLGYLGFASTDVGLRPRLLMVAFPLSMALGVKLRREPWYSLVLAVSAALLVVLAVATAGTLYITP